MSAVPTTIPSYFINEGKILNFTGTEFEEPQSIGVGAITKFDTSINQKEMRFKAPNRGRLLPLKSKLVVDVKVTDAGANDSHPFNYVQSLFSNKFYLINTTAFCNNQQHYGYFHSLMCAVHYDSDFIAGSSGYKVGCSLSALPTGTKMRFYLPLVNPKYLNQEDFLNESLDLESIHSFEVVYQIPNNVLDATSGSTSGLEITARMDWFILHSNSLKNAVGMAPVTKSYTRYHFEQKIVQPGTSKIYHEFIPKFKNLKYIILCQREASVISGNAVDKYTNQFVQSSLRNAQLTIDGKPVYNNPLELDYSITWIELMEKTFGRDVSKALGAHFDFTDSANQSKMFLCLPLSLDSKVASGKNTQESSKTVVFTADSTVVNQTHFEYFLVYTEIGVINPLDKSYRTFS